MAKTDFHQVNRNRFHMDVDHPPKGKKEKRAYVRRKARQSEKGLIKAELEAYNAQEELDAELYWEDEAMEAINCYLYGPCEKCKRYEHRGNG